MRRSRQQARVRAEAYDFARRFLNVDRLPAGVPRVIDDNLEMTEGYVVLRGRNARWGERPNLQWLPSVLYPYRKPWSGL